MKKLILGSLFVASGLLAISAIAPSGYAQGRCYNVAAFVAPNPLKCQQVGTDYIGKPIWMCCE